MFSTAPNAATLTAETTATTNARATSQPNPGRAPSPNSEASPELHQLGEIIRPTLERQFLTLAATNKIDMRLARRTFGHLLSLPIDYFETATAGVIVRPLSYIP